MKDKQMTPQDSLELITRMIENRKSNWRDNGFIMIFWGWLIITSSIGHYILHHLELYNYIWMAWLTTILGAIYTPFHFAKIKKNLKKGEYLDKISGFIWWIFAINAFTFGFIFTPYWNHLTTGLILIILGISAAIDGRIIRFRPMVIGGIITNFLGLFCIYWTQLYNNGKVESISFLILFVGLGMTLTNIIPGYLIRKQYKADHHG